MILGINILYHFPTKPSYQTVNSKLPPQIFYRRKKAITEPGKLSKTRDFWAHDPKKNTMGFDGQFIATKTAEVIPKGSLVREPKMALIKAKA